VARVTDQLSGLALLLRFVGQRQPDLLPSIEQLFNVKHEQTIRQIVRDFNRQPISPVLRAVFNPDDWDDATPLPNALHRHLCSTRVSQATVSLASFGDFHQLCLAHPLVETWDTSRCLGGVRRSRGIHYTPPSIVDYLTHRVLDHLSFPARGNGSERFQVLDPSCGCGAFLASAAKQLFQTFAKRDGRDLSLQNRLDFLPCILGIDIDAQAVVWARRVLLLSAWQDALRANVDTTPTEPIRIPDLRSTIIATDFLSTPIPPVDAVLGGPPFVRIHQLRLADPQKLAQYKATFQTARTGQFDLYMLFFEKAIGVLREGGRLGWSVSNTFLRSHSGRAVRQLISSKCAVHEIVEFETRKLYPDAVTQVALVLLEKTTAPVSCRHVWIRGNRSLHAKVRMLLKSERSSDPSVTITDLTPMACHGIDWSLISPERSLALAKIKRFGSRIGMLPMQISSGVVTGADDVFLVRAIRARDDGICYPHKPAAKFSPPIPAAPGPSIKYSRDPRFGIRIACTQIVLFSACPTLRKAEQRSSSTLQLGIGDVAVHLAGAAGNFILPPLYRTQRRRRGSSAFFSGAVGPKWQTHHMEASHLCRDRCAPCYSVLLCVS